MRFKIAYCIYLVVSLFYAVVPFFGAITIRHFLTLFMLVLCFWEGGLKLDKFLKWYMVFMFFYVLVEFLYGFLPYVFPKLLGTYLASIVLYMATKIMIKKYDAGDLIIMVLVACGVVNAIVAIAQFFGSSLAEIIPKILHISISEKAEEIYDQEDLHGYNVGGLMEAVRSGYYLAATSVLALYNRRGRIRIYNWAAFAVIMVALILVQERSGLVSGLVCTFIFLSIVSMRFRSNIVTIGLVTAAVVYFINHYAAQYVTFEDLRYATEGMEDDRRVNYALNAIKWVLHNPMGGAFYYYYFSGGYYPHNFIANALLYGGIYGGTVLICILIAQLVKIGKIFLSYITRKKYPVLLIVSCAAYLSYTINSFFHNASLVFASETIFLLWAMIASLIEREKRKLF